MKLLEIIKGFFYYSTYTSNEEAARIIKGFVKNTLEPYEWDDFETIEQNNQNVDLALRLCFYFADKFPPEKKSEYCGEGAHKYFLKIADALERDLFKKIDLEKALTSMKNKQFPSEIAKLLKL